MQHESPSTLWQDLASRWRSEFHVYRAPDADSAVTRARHMQSLQRLTPLMMIGKLAGGVVLAASLRTEVPPWQLVPWLATLLVVCGAALLNWWHHRRSARLAASATAITRTIQGAAVHGLLWSGATAMWLATIAHDQQLLLSTLVVGMTCAGAFALASVPQAALAYIAVMTVGSVVGLGRAGGPTPA